MSKERMKGFVLGAMTMMLILMTSLSAYALIETKDITASFNDIKIYINEKLLEAKDAKGNVVEPMIYNGTTYIPVRAVGEAFDQSVSWDKQTSSVYVGAQPAVVYKNTDYGFNFNLPDRWRSFSIVTDKWKGFEIAGSQGADVAETGALISIRNPLWTIENPYQDIPIMVFTLEQWSNLQLEKFGVSAAPINPSELGRNNKYVFALPARYNFAFPLGYEEVETILKGNPLQPATVN